MGSVIVTNILFHDLSYRLDASIFVDEYLGWVDLT